jgi:hypothetical protein
MPCERSDRLREMLRVMVAVPRRKHLDSHAEIAGGLPHVRAGLHQPSRCGVPKCVRDDIITEPGVLHGTRKCFTNALYRVAIPLDGKPLSLPFPASQVCQQLRRQWDRAADASSSHACPLGVGKRRRGRDLYNRRQTPARMRRRRLRSPWSRCRARPE